MKYTTYSATTPTSPICQTVIRRHHVTRAGVSVVSVVGGAAAVDCLDVAGADPR